MSEDGITRRKALLGAAGAAGVVALAGCSTTQEETQQADNVVQTASEAPPQSPGAGTNNAYWDYVILSMEWQNRQIQAQTEGIALLLDANNVTSGDS